MKSKLRNLATGLATLGIAVAFYAPSTAHAFIQHYEECDNLGDACFIVTLAELKEARSQLQNQLNSTNQSFNKFSDELQGKRTEYETKLNTAVETFKTNTNTELKNIEIRLNDNYDKKLTKLEKTVIDNVKSLDQRILTASLIDQLRSEIRQIIREEMNK